MRPRQIACRSSSTRNEKRAASSSDAAASKCRAVKATALFLEPCVWWAYRQEATELPRISVAASTADRAFGRQNDAGVIQDIDPSVLRSAIVRHVWDGVRGEVFHTDLPRRASEWPAWSGHAWRDDAVRADRDVRASGTDVGRHIRDISVRTATSERKQYQCDRLHVGQVAATSMPMATPSRPFRRMRGAGS